MKNETAWFAAILFLLVAYIFIQQLSVDALRKTVKAQQSEITALTDSLSFYTTKIEIL